MPRYLPSALSAGAVAAPVSLAPLQRVARWGGVRGEHHARQAFNAGTVGGAR